MKNFNFIILATIFLICCGEGNVKNEIEDIECERHRNVNDTPAENFTEYDAGYNTGLLTVLTKGKRDCEWIFEKHVGEMRERVGLPPLKITTCWCNGFYDGYNSKQ